ncbi:MAG: translation elongation factor Ts [Croceimicrobium sp.]|nr:translation elongation factor Ts [Bacteroidota bacterium]
MAKITAAEVNKLRKQTGAGMMDCKKALVEAEGDFEQAVDILRKKGQKVAAKRADRDATEGCVLAGTNGDNSFGAIVSLNCETDFVAKNDSFVELTQSLLNVALENKFADKDALMAATLGDMTVAEKLVEQTGVIGEKLEIGSYEVVDAAFVASYIHAGNKLATLVGLTKEAPEAGKNVAMQAAAMNPIALNKDGVDEETINRELEVGKDLARQEGKPEAMLDKIAMGRLGKFFKENTLTQQAYIRDNKLTVEKYLQSEDKDLAAVSFKRVGLGV